MKPTQTMIMIAQANRFVYRDMLDHDRSCECHDYLRDKQNMLQGMEERSRAFTIIFRTVHQANLRLESVIVAMGVWDRYHCLSSRSEQKDLKLTAATCLFLAMRTTEPSCVVNAATVNQMTNGLYSENDINACEDQIMTAIKWKLDSSPNAYKFLRKMLELLPDSIKSTVLPKLYTSGVRQLLLASGDYATVILNRSQLACAAILNALEEIHPPLEHQIQSRFMSEISDLFELKVDSPLMNGIRGRLKCLDRTSDVSFGYHLGWARTIQ